MKQFDTLRENNFHGKSWYRLPLLSIIFLDTRNIVKRRKIPLRIVSVLWDQKVSMENRDTRFLSFPQYFSIPGSSWKTEGFLYENIRHSERKQFSRKIVIPATSFINNFFRYQKYSETQKNSSSNCFGSVRPKSFDGKSWHPLSVFSSLYFHTRKFLEDRRDPLRNSWALWETKSNQQKIVLPHSFINERLRYPKLFETQKGSSR